MDPTSVTLADVSGDGLRDVIATAQNVASGNLVVFRNSSPPACLADFDGAGGVQVNDLFAFLTAWFAGNPAADMNQNGGNDVPDIFQFLSLWFAGCP